ncbi:MAG: acyltransferase [Brevundimonas sp.]|nr:MAG: acyltransferase [Brevundimonas sp.]
MIAPLTSVRILLALGVVLFHYQLQWSLTDDGHSGLLNRARLGVDAFFILSGFILTHVYCATVGCRTTGISSWPDWPAFIPHTPP